MELDQITDTDLALELERDPKKKAPNTQRSYLHHLIQFKRYCNGRPLSHKLVLEYLAELQRRNLSVASINQFLAAIRWWARKKQQYEETVLTEAERVASIPDLLNNAKQKVGRHVPEAEIDALLKVCATDHTAAGIRDFGLIELGFAFGLRRGELASLTLENFKVTDQEAGLLTIQGKGGKKRVVEVYKNTYAALSDWLGIRGQDPGLMFYEIRRGGHIQIGKGLTTEGLATILTKRCQQAGIDRITWHDFRRTFVDDLLDAGVDMFTIQKILGHESPETTSRYDRRLGSDETRKRAIRRRSGRE
jgi:integrase/recombinase XerD